jgi:p-hydroxybenzoate 3-monooxygenase
MNPDKDTPSGGHVPPTGAKGLNLPASDVLVLARALKAFYEHGRTAWLDEYSDLCPRRVWKAQRFSWWMTSTLHRFPDESAFDHQRQIADLDYLTSSRAAMTSLAERYVGLPADVSNSSPRSGPGRSLRVKDWRSL